MAHLLGPVLRVAARLAATPAAGSAFDFARRLCLADDGRVDEYLTKGAKETPGLLGLAAEVAKSAARTKTALDGGANGAAAFLSAVFES